MKQQHQQHTAGRAAVMYTPEKDEQCGAGDTDLEDPSGSHLHSGIQESFQACV